MHRHHIIPKHMGGTDDPSNIAFLTAEEHALAHKELYEKYGLWQDKLAYEGLMGLKDKEEIVKEVVRKTHTGKVVSEETRRKMSESAKKRCARTPVWTKGRKRTEWLSPETLAQLDRTGIKHTAETRKKMSRPAWNKGLKKR